MKMFWHILTAFSTNQSNHVLYNPERESYSIHNILNSPFKKKTSSNFLEKQITQLIKKTEDISLDLRNNNISEFTCLRNNMAKVDDKNRIVNESRHMQMKKYKNNDVQGILEYLKSDEFSECIRILVEKISTVTISAKKLHYGRSQYNTIVYLFVDTLEYTFCIVKTEQDHCKMRKKYLKNGIYMLYRIFPKLRCTVKSFYNAMKNLKNSMKFLHKKLFYTLLDLLKLYSNFYDNLLEIFEEFKSFLFIHACKNLNDETYEKFRTKNRMLINEINKYIESLEACKF